MGWIILWRIEGHYLQICEESLYVPLHGAPERETWWPRRPSIKWPNVCRNSQPGCPSQATWPVDGRADSPRSADGYRSDRSACAVGPSRERKG
jgi:hypothetical protein